MSVVALLVVGTGIALFALRASHATARAVPGSPVRHRLQTPPSGPRAPTTSTAPTSPSSGHANPFGPSVVAYLGTRTGPALAAVEDLNTGETWTFGQGAPQDAASIVKLDILETLLAQEEASGHTLSNQDEALAQAMIEESDNGSATDLWDAVGSASGISAFNKRVGLRETVPSPCVQCAGFPWPGWGLTTTTPSDQIALLRQVVGPNSVLSITDRNLVLRLLENVTSDQRWGVSGGVPSTATVALKNGWLPLDAADTDWQINSIGWVSGDGRNYLMAVLTTGNPTEQYGIDTIDELSSMIWSTMA